MLHYVEPNAHEGAILRTDPEGATDVISFERIFAMLRRQMWLMAISVVIGVGLGVAYLASAVPLYTVTTDLLIDEGQSKLMDDIASASSVLQGDSGILSQVELIKSDHIAAAVVRELGLDQDDRFLDGDPSLMRSFRSGLRGLLARVVPRMPPLNAEVAWRKEAAVAILQGNLDVDRVGRTYVLRLSYTSSDPQRAIDIARTFGDAYLEDQLQSKYESTKRASTWLQERIAELKQQSFDADLAVQKFRNDNGLLTSNNGLLSQQQLTEVQSQLIAAEATTAGAKAQLEQIESILKEGRTDAVVNDALASSLINSLREKYLDAARRETEITKKLGPDHIQVIRLKAEMREYERLIFGELGRIAESYRSTYAVALDRQKSIAANLARLKDLSAGDNTIQVTLRELDRESATFKSLYDNFLQRYQQAVQQQSFPITDARVITEPTMPGSPSAPKKPMVMALFMMMGVGVGAALGGFREYRDRFFRLGTEVRSELNMDFLGYTPRILPADAEKGADQEQARSTIWPLNSTSTYVRQRPMSAFSETLRNVKVAADLGLPEPGAKVIGVVSCLPSEGKSMISANFGNLLAMQGFRTLIIDGDIRNPGLTRSLERKPQNGLFQAVLDPTDPQEAFLRETYLPLAVLPVVLRARVFNTSDVLSSPSMATLLAHCKTEFDYIVVDLPPIGPVVDAKAFAHRVDAFVFVVEWGRTPRRLVRSTLESNRLFRSKSLGVILNKADNRKMKLYQSYGSAESYSNSYKSYYQD